MARRQQSSIDLLPDPVRDQLNELLNDRKVTQKEAVERINAILADLKAAGQLDEGTPDRVTKSSVNRYDLQMRDIGERIRQSREVADRWIGKFGAAPQGQVGNLVNEILRTLSFDVTLYMQGEGLDEENAPAVVGMLKDLALTSMRLEKAANLNVEREKEIRAQALADAAEIIGEEAHAQGMTDEQANFWRKKFLGAK